jgi:predicted dehydrogenase
VGLQAIAAGKHVYSEKPFAIDLESAKQLRESGQESGLRVGCAPDTFLGAGIQTARQQMDTGAIGSAVGGTAFMCGHGHESWHPNPAFYYDVGGGPMLDMGPYYVTALISILGPVRRVAGVTTKTFEERIATSEAIRGLKIPVKTTTHLTGSIEFVGGAIVSMIMSFDMWRHSLPCIEVYGTDGSMQVPDPNGFGGSVRVSQPRSDWEDIPLTFPNNARIIGVIDMVRAIRNNRPHRVCGDLAYHALEVMLAFDRSSQTGEHVNIESFVDRPNPFPTGLNEWEVED